ncbi:unnamed protein product [Orchesella dallaii]|uniref:Peptidase A2 domain-containing protein n=1 Tax=Orchesella dallaii TaxID=48710 RepID=A0ABP1PHF7_9HEXA
MMNLEDGVTDGMADSMKTARTLDGLKEEPLFPVQQAQSSSLNPQRNMQIVRAEPRLQDNQRGNIGALHPARQNQIIVQRHTSNNHIDMLIRTLHMLIRDNNHMLFNNDNNRMNFDGNMCTIEPVTIIEIRIPSILNVISLKFPSDFKTEKQMEEYEAPAERSTTTAINAVNLDILLRNAPFCKTGVLKHVSPEFIMMGMNFNEGRVSPILLTMPVGTLLSIPWYINGQFANILVDLGACMSVLNDKYINTNAANIEPEVFKLID